MQDIHTVSKELGVGVETQGRKSQLQKNNKKSKLLNVSANIQQGKLSVSVSLMWLEHQLLTQE